MEYILLNRISIMKKEFIKSFSFLVFLLSITGSCYSQYFMVSYGDNPTLLFDKSRSGFGFDIGLGYDIKMGKHIGLNTQLGLGVYSNSNDKTESNYRSATASLLLNRKFFVMAKETAYVYVYGGGEMTYGLSSTTITSEYSLSYQSFPKYEQDMYSEVITSPMYGTVGESFSPLNRFDFRASAGIGFNVGGFIDFSLNYVHGLNPISLSPDGNNIYANFIRLRLCVGLREMYNLPKQIDKKDF